MHFAKNRGTIFKCSLTFDFRNIHTNRLVLRDSGTGTVSDQGTNAANV